MKKYIKISFLERLDQVTSEKLMKMATLASVLVAIIIISLKIVAWLMTDSLSILSSLVDSLLDVIASTISFYAVRYSLEPADQEHRFGHGKAEDIAAFAQSAFIAGSGIFIIIEAFSRFLNPTNILNQNVGISVMVISTVLTLFLVCFQTYVIKRTSSTAVTADSLHYKMDLYINIVVILSFVFTGLFNINLIDPVIALIIAVFIIRGAYKVGKTAFDKLMDHEMPEEDRKEIIGVVLENDNVMGVHDLRTRFSGNVPFIQMHIELKGTLTLNEAHKISEDVENSLKGIYNNAEIIIHQDTDEDVEVSLEKGRAVKLKQKR